MIVVVDGYNMLRSGNDGGSRGDKDRFVAWLYRYFCHKKSDQQAFYLVFDGGSFRFAETEKTGSFFVVNSGYVDSADDWIVDFVQKNREKGLLVVTDDRELRARLGRDVQLVISCADFNTFIKQAELEAKEEQVVPTSQDLVQYETEADMGELEVDYDELRRLIDKSTRGILPKDGTINRRLDVKGSQAYKSSKRVKQALRLTKKL